MVPLMLVSIILFKVSEDATRKDSYKMTIEPSDANIGMVPVMLHSLIILQECQCVQIQQGAFVQSLQVWQIEIGDGSTQWWIVMNVSDLGQSAYCPVIAGYISFSAAIAKLGKVPLNELP